MRTRQNPLATGNCVTLTAWFSVAALALLAPLGCGSVDVADNSSDGTLPPGGDPSEAGDDDDDDDDNDNDNDDDDDDDNDDDDNDENSEYSYYADTKNIIDHKCANCHEPGNIGPFPLTNYAEVKPLASLMKHSLAAGTMPPWPLDDSCNDYAHSFGITPEQRATLLTWIDDGAAEGDPDDFEPWPDDDGPDIDYNMELQMPEPYRPTKEPDDYRCFLIDWPGDHDQYMTAFDFEAGRPDMVHHVLAYKVSPDNADSIRAADDQEAGPGYTCYGGPSPNGTFEGFELFGEWVPGNSLYGLPEGTGIKFEPGELLVVQFHYNTIAVDPEPDQSTIFFRFEEEVERPAATKLHFDIQWPLGNMPIPAGNPDVSHENTSLVSLAFGDLAADIGLSPFDELAIHVVGPHMHQLGKSARVEVVRASGERECLVNMPNWDFNWQGGFTLKSEVVVGPLDQIYLNCHFDNSPENQPIIDGEQIAPRDVNWGDGTLDEMCLTGILVSRPANTAPLAQR